MSLRRLVSSFAKPPASDQMARVAINATNLRPGGGLQVFYGLVARFSPAHEYFVLCTDAASKESFGNAIAGRDYIHCLDPVGKIDNVSIFKWGMFSMKYWLQNNAMDCVVGVNHHFPSGKVPQIVYHLNQLRFEREVKSIFSGGELADRLRDWRAQAALRSAEANLFESEMLLATAQKTGSQITNPKVIYIGLDEKRPAPARIVASKIRPAILAVTSGAPHKDNATLLRMLAELVKMTPAVNWQLIIAGGNPEADFDDLRRLAKTLNVAEYTEYVGFRSHEWLSQTGAGCCCLVTTSLVESFCMVALEAMSWGCPAVVANISSMPESVGDAGLLAEPNNASDFAEKVASLWNDRVFRNLMVEKGLKRSRELTWSSAARQMEDVINDVTRLRGVGGE